MPAPDSTHAPPPVWSAQDLADPHGRSDKADRVRRMFGAIAHAYDLNNRVHSLGRDQAWRRFAVRAACLRPTDVVLDVACGTGDLTRAFARAGAARVIGLDFTREMLAIARGKREADLRGPRGRSRVGAERTEYIEADALALPLDDSSVDVVSIAFGIRNIADPARALEEFRRVLRPGGRVVILEFDRVRLPLLGWFADLYTRRVMPWTATLISGDRTGAYRYLPASVSAFVPRERLGAMLRERGFTGVRCSALSLGICACHVAVRA